LTVPQYVVILSLLFHFNEWVVIVPGVGKEKVVPAGEKHVHEDVKEGHGAEGRVVGLPGMRSC
jgi:hypothetical protein